MNTIAARGIVPEPIARQPWEMLIPLLLITGFGGLVLYSAGGGSMQPFAMSHFIRFLVFSVMAAIIASMPRDAVRVLTYPAYLAVLVMLLGVEIVGQVGGGSQRWLEAGPIRIQPSEIMKPAVVLAMARFYETLPAGMIGSWRSVVPSGMLIVLPISLVLLQPDLGTSVAIAFGGVVVMFLAGLPLWWFLLAGGTGIAAMPLIYFFALRPYQQARVTTFLDPENDPLGAGYHIAQSKIAIGSGGIFGKGFNNGTQSHLNYLPEPHTDFVFATMAEEWGLVGGLFVLTMYALILRWGWKVANESQDRFCALLAAGATATIFFYIAINLLMVMGMAPAKGIPLPWMSHGGSSMMTNMICIGLLMMVNRWNRMAPRRGLTV
ncbi:rod shape determining protein RodA [Erythromicrobium ramosum]|jgi:rod shape determining protein RodA|uniref:Peptidoglycan glycosyltransferase MrdB n=1 Tax=Erythrobacter ramosus TaxID=35811 RepID=A0A6I4UMZ1_9SPHN|nr:rod shape-determining protein RodA [Erythrobacter ramosus]MBB3776101.1 rod shape determining protein RodA [Erythrobacter ramosus]MXP38813.1 rod shape-determining protein RodA [Erythrobacter ramosus]